VFTSPTLCEGCNGGKREEEEGKEEIMKRT